MKYQLRDYQAQGVNDLRTAYRQGYKAPIYVLPTAGGKTIVFCHIAEQAAARGNRIMILVHRKELLDQASEKLTEIGTPHGLIRPGRVMTGDLVQVASVDTVIRRLDRIPPPDIIIIDEAHHCIKGNKWGKVAAYYPGAYLLGVTATPCRTNGDGLGAQYQGYFDRLVCGPSIRELIDRGYLSQPVVYAPPIGIDITGVKTRGGDYAQDDLELRIDKSQITGDAVGHYKKICPGAPAIAFCISIKHAANVAEKFNAAGIPAARLDGTMTNAQRAFRIRALGDGQIKVLTSCEIVSEGTDIPIVTAAILLRPTKSLGMFLQQCGRILRIHPEKKESIILDHVNNTGRHGLVDEVRSWTLAEQERQARRGNGSEVERVRQCKKCFAVFPIHLAACPQCGEKWIGQERKIDQVQGTLKRLTPEEMAEIRARQDRRRTQGRANSLAQLLRLEQIRGYKPGWANHIWAARQKKAAQRANRLY